MKDTGQGDYSRVLFEPRKHYASVRLQQGRVLLDSDWNAEMDLLAHRLRTETRDTLGPAGGPEGDAGFGIEAEGLLSFDGRGRFLTYDGEGVAGAGELPGFTLEARLYPRSGGAASVLFSRLVPRAGTLAADLRLDLDADGRLVLHRAGVEGPPLTASVGVTFDRLNHVALAYDAGAATLYLNGVAVAADRRGGPCAAPAELAFVFGAALEDDRVRHGFDGVLLEMAMWRRALGEERIQSDLARPPSGREDELIGAWSFARPAAKVEDRGGRGRFWLLGGGDPAHAPAWILRQVTIGGGRYYVDGLLCENDRTVPFTAQPDHPGARLPRFSRDRDYLFYLDVWELLVTAEQDPDLAEVALGGADTTARTRTVAQVRVLPLPARGRAGPDGVPDAWEAFLRRARRGGRLRARRVPSAEMLGNLLYRVEIHGSGGLRGGPRAAAREEPAAEAERVDEPAAGGPVCLRLADWPDPDGGPWRVGDRVEVRTPDADAERPGPTATVVTVDAAARTVAITGDAPSGSAPGDPLGSASRARLRRVATFKWSRQNASVLCPLAEVEPGGRTVILADPGRRGLELEAGDWVEYCDSDTMLGPPSGPLYRVESVDESLLQVTLGGAPVPAGGRPGAHPALRRWDQRRGSGDEELIGGTIVAEAGWLPLEGGIEVSFTGDGPYRAGDYWSMPARTGTEEIEWPQEVESAAPAALPPAGVAHHYAPLALLSFGDDGYLLRDCRKTFRPLVDGAVSKAGDTMYGPLVIRSHLTVEGGGPEDPGAVTAEVFYGPLGSPDSVATDNLADRSVTAPKLAPEVGIVPPGYAILGAGPEPPPGYAATGSAMTVFHPLARWSERAPFPRRDPGPLRGAAAAGRLYVALESGELWEYDPGEDRWRARCPRPEPLQDFAVAALGGKVYVAGGVDPRRGGKSGATLVYDPAADRWSAGSEMPTPRSRLTLAAAGGKLYALGGLARSWLGERVSRANEEYEPEGDQWRRRAPLPRRRYDLGAGAAGGTLHAVGGAGRPWCGLWGRTVTNVHWEYQPAADRWHRSPAPLAVPAAHPAVAPLEDRLFVAGGEGALGPLAEVAEYDPVTRAWLRRPPLPEPAASIAAGALGGELLTAADAAGCPSPPLWELPAATRYYVFVKLAGEEEYGPGAGSEPGGADSPADADSTAERDRAFEELAAELDVLPDVDDAVLE